MVAQPLEHLGDQRWSKCRQMSTAGFGVFALRGPRPSQNLWDHLIGMGPRPKKKGWEEDVRPILASGKGEHWAAEREWKRP